MRVLPHFVLWTVGLERARTMHSPAECACLERHAAGRKRLVEIGCWHGVNTRRLRRVMAPDGVLFGIDLYEPGRLGFSAHQIIAHSEVGKEPNGQMRWIRMTYLDAARWWTASNEPPVDFVLSDCDNSYEGFRATWEAWSAIAAGGARYVLTASRPTLAKPISNAGSVAFTRDVILADARFHLIEQVGTFTVLEKHR